MHVPMYVCSEMQVNVIWNYWHQSFDTKQALNVL